jgi:CBS domain-containing protein
MALLRGIMVKDVIRTGPDADILDVLKVMDREKTSCAVICEDRVPVGIITSGDVIGLAVAESTGSWSDIRVADVMSSPVMVLRADDPIESAVDLTERCGIRRVPLVDANGELVGIVTHGDLLRTYVERMCRGSRELGSLHVMPQGHQRRATRHTLRAPVEYRAEALVGRGTTWDLSESGVHVAWSDPPPLPGTEVRLRLSFGPGAELEIRGEVVRETETGFAVRFLEIDDVERELLQRALADETEVSEDEPRPD